MASMRAGQVMACPVSARTLAAASRALSFLALGSAVTSAGAVLVTACLGAFGAFAAFAVLERLLAAARFGVLSAGAFSSRRGGLVPLRDGVCDWWVFLVAMVLAPFGWVGRSRHRDAAVHRQDRTVTSTAPSVQAPSGAIPPFFRGFAAGRPEAALLPPVEDGRDRLQVAQNDRVAAALRAGQ